MKIEYFGHSSFKLTSVSGASIVCDPYDGIGYSMPEVSANAVTVSHHHYDHDFVKAVSGKPVVIEGGNHTVGDIKITSVQSYHDEVSGKKRGGNVIFKFEIDGITVCHLGDLGEPFTETRVKTIAPVDVLLIPVGGVYTIDYLEAEKYVCAISPKIAIPIHYRTKNCTVNISGAQDFLNLFNKEQKSFVQGTEIEITKEDLCGGTKIIFFEGLK